MNRFLLVGIAIALLPTACHRNDRVVNDPVTREGVWQAIQPLAERYRMEPAFIYAIVVAESNFDPRAENGEARGLMQLTPAAWRTVSVEPYEPTVWNWRKNLELGVDYLPWCRNYLDQRKNFSYPLLLASFHHGIDYAEERNFDLRRLDPPDNLIDRKFWEGNLSPVTPPES